MSSKAATVKEYLDGLPEDRRDVVSAVRKTIRKNLPPGYDEAMQWGMITYSVPLARFPDTDNGQPLCYVAVAAQKNHFAVIGESVARVPVEKFLARYQQAEQGTKPRTKRKA